VEVFQMRILTAALGLGLFLSELPLPTTAAADSLATEPVAGTAALQRVVAVVSARDGSGRMFFAEQSGRIHISAAGALLPVPFVDLSAVVRTTGFEEGLLGLAFHPDYRTNRRFFVYYTNLAGDNVVARYEASASNPNVAIATGSVVIVFPHPVFEFHNGGGLAFGNDGFLYIGTGDGGGTAAAAQDLGSLLGKVHRLDVDGVQPYAIPPGNPFVSTPGARGEIWAYGLRNPWRLTFDRATGDLWISDVGFESEDEIDRQPPAAGGGQNYGWPLVEGTVCHLPPCPSGLTPPVVTHSSLEVLAGGYRYRGSKLPLLKGAYVYGGWQFGKLFGAWPQPDGSWRGVPLADTPELVWSLGEDESGDLYVGSFAGVHRIVATHTLPKMSVDIASLVYGAEGGRLRFDVRLSSADLLHDVTADFALTPGTALAGEDYVATAGTITFHPGEALQSVYVDLVDDDRDEPYDETFTFYITNLNHARSEGTQTVTGHVQDDDPPSVARVGDASAPEPVAAGSSCRFPVTLDTASAFEIQIAFQAQDGTAQAFLDYEQPSPNLVQLLPGQTSAEIAIPLLPDLLAEDNETFTLQLTSSPTYANLVTSSVTCTIIDDDALPVPGTEVAHGSVMHGRFTGSADTLRLMQSPRSSYEVVADAVSGDATPGLGVLRFSADNATVAQSGNAPGTGSSVSLRWQNASNVAIGNQPLRVRSGQCGSDCGPDDVYRVRAYDTTYRAARFNNTGGQGTVLVLQNPTTDTVNATAWFWSATGTLLHGHPLSLPPHGGMTLSLPSIPALAARHGSVTLSHDAPYGALAGKTVGLDPTGGFAFDTPLEPHRR
jgi:glucose/arabinose dehydrogenase